MDNANITESFLYYASNLKVVEEYPLNIQPKVNMAIIEYGAGRVINKPIIEIDGISIDLRVFLRNIFNNIDAEKRRYQSKKLINHYKDTLSKELDTNIYLKHKEEYERSIKDLRKLAIEVNKHDIKDIETRVKQVLPSEYYKNLSDSLNDIDKLHMVADHVNSIKENNYLTPLEYDQLKSLLVKADQNKQDAQKRLAEEKINKLRRR